MSENERRDNERRVVWVPLEVDSEASDKALAVSKNISEGGALMVTGQAPEVGSQVTLRFGAGDDVRELVGKVVRIEPNDADPRGLWPYRLAIELDESIPDVEQFARELEGRSST